MTFYILSLLDIRKIHPLHQFVDCVSFAVLVHIVFLSKFKDIKFVFFSNLLAACYDRWIVVRNLNAIWNQLSEQDPFDITKIQMFTGKSRECVSHQISSIQIVRPQLIFLNLDQSKTENWLEGIPENSTK